MSDRDRNDLQRRLGSLETVVSAIVAIMERSHLRRLAQHRLIQGFHFEIRREHDRLRRMQRKPRNAGGENMPTHDE